MSHSTPEAEIVAADWALRREGIPMLDMWDILAGKGQKVVFHDDNESMIKICKSGRNPTMRHTVRFHGVAVAWLKEQFDSGNYELRYVPSAQQAADIYTKGLTMRTSGTQFVARSGCTPLLKLTCPTSSSFG